MNTFFRALVGWAILTCAIVGMALVALWALKTFGGSAWWAGLLIIIIAMAAEIGVYRSTLHEPIYDWIREPKREAERKAAADKATAANARMSQGGK